MDALSHILDDIHLGQAEYVYIHGCGDWLLNQPQQPAVMIYVVNAGSVSIFMRDETINLEAGAILLIPSGRQHQIGNPDPKHNLTTSIRTTEQSIIYSGHDNMLMQTGTGSTSAIVIAVRCQIDTEMSRPLLSALPNSLLLHEEKPAWLELGLQFLGLEAERHRPGRDTLLTRLANMFFVECVRDYVEQLPETSESWLTALRDPNLTAALSAIHNQLAHPWTVADLANIACMSRSSFAERFNDVIGQPPLAYLSAHRLRTATRYLSQNDESIARISERVGYTSEAAFSQAFKRRYEMSPSHYRKESKIK
jgi:AraC family transcriptional regulator, alkane utilization regulator